MKKMGVGPCSFFLGIFFLNFRYSIFAVCSLAGRYDCRSQFIPQSGTTNLATMVS